MYPMYKFMDSHPCQRNQVPHNPHYYPRFEPSPHHMNIDPARSSLAYESWPYGGNYGYPHPPQCHNCCIRNNSPNLFAFRPPYPYFPPSPYSSCNYTAYPGMYPAPYVPTPHFSMEQPQYEYEKNHHCCGCHNHQCNKKGGSNLKIEEEDQDKKNESSESLVPFGFKNSPYPVVLLPPDHMKNREQMKPNGFRGVKDEVDSQVVKPHDDSRSFEQPNIRNIWSPYYMNKLESPKQTEDSPRKQHHDDMKEKQFPFPIIWMPYKPEDTDCKVSNDADPGNSVEQEATSPSKSTLPMLPDAEDKRRCSKENEVNTGSEIQGNGLKKDHVTKTIPVKQMEQNEKVLERKPEEASQKQDSDAKEQKITQVGKKQSSSPTKSSRLPPVCLRVDPLPKKKRSKGSSRSPSPPGGKGRFVESPSESSNPPISNEKENAQLDKSFAPGLPKKNIEGEPSKSKTRVVEVAQGTSKADKLQDKCPVFPEMKGQRRDQTGEIGTSKAANEPKHQTKGVAAEAEFSNKGNQSSEVREAENGKEDVVLDMNGNRSELSNDKAATMIQLAYRGFNVRRWEPLKKLKQIANIKEQMAVLENQIQALESSDDNEIDSKQKTIITEAIMGLLLKLDALQGLHPTVRESRKSVAKELVSMQEKLDLLNSMKQPPESEQTLTAEPSEDTCQVVENDVPLDRGIQGQPVKYDDDLTNPHEEIKFDAKEPHEEQPLCPMEALSSSHQVDNAEIMVGNEETKNVEEVMEEFSSGNAVRMDNEALELSSECKENLNDVNAVAVEKSEDHEKAEQSLPNLISCSEELIANSCSEVTDCALKMKDDGADELEEIPSGVLDAETSDPGPNEIGKDEVLQCDKSDLTACIPEERATETERLENNMGPENMRSRNGQEENAGVIERDAAVTVDVPEHVRDARSIHEDVEITGVDDKVCTEKNGEEFGKCSDISDISTTQSQEEADTMRQSSDTTGTEDSATDKENLLEKMPNTIETLDSGNTILTSAEPQLSTSDKVKENHVSDKQKIEEENVGVQGEELPASDEAVVSVLNDKCKQYNVEVVQKPLEESFELKVEEPAASDNATLVTEEPVDENIAMATPISEAAISETHFLGEEESDVAEDHNTYPATEATSCFGPTVGEIQVMDAKELKGCKKEDLLPSSPTASQVSFESDALLESDRKLIEENGKLREVMEKLIKAGTEQLSAISGLSERVKYLEKRLSRKKKLKLRRNRVPRAGSVCMKPSNDYPKESSLGLAV